MLTVRGCIWPILASHWKGHRSFAPCILCTVHHTHDARDGERYPGRAWPCPAPHLCPRCGGHVILLLLPQPDLHVRVRSRLLLTTRIRSLIYRYIHNLSALLAFSNKSCDSRRIPPFNHGYIHIQQPLYRRQSPIWGHFHQRQSEEAMCDCIRGFSNRHRPALPPRLLRFNYRLQGQCLRTCES